MYKLISLFSTPADPVAFEARWAAEFMPLAEQMPGLRRSTVSRIDGTPAGPAPWYLLYELFFDDKDALLAAMASAKGTAAAQCLMAIAAKEVTLLLAEHLEDVPESTSQPQTPDSTL